MLHRRNPKNYHAYASVYDSLKGDRSETIGFLRDLIQKYNPDARTLLDLACGTGVITHDMSQSYETTGIDLSPFMLREARRRLPSEALIQADMQNFSVSTAFDVVYCVHNSVNHLLEFEEWEATFDNVARHLADNGIFIFDSVAADRMDKLAELPAEVTRLDDNYVLTQVTKDSRAQFRYVWDVKVFLRRAGAAYRLFHEPVNISSYPVARVCRSLAENFEILDVIQVAQPQSRDEIDRLYYVCRVLSRNNV